MHQNWQPNIKDYNIITAEKANFIYESAEKYLLDTIKVSEAQDSKAFQLLSILIAFISAITGYMFLKCDFATRHCTAETNIFWPGIAMLSGFLIAASMIVIGCIFPKGFHFSGNEPKNLLTEEICRADIQDIKTSTAIAMQQRVTENRTIVQNKAYWLKWACITMLGTPFLVVASILITGLIAFICPV